MNEEIPEEILTEWKVEINLIAEKWFTDNGWVPTESRVIPAVSIALAAKTSSYELKENLRKRGNNLSKECVELQKEIQKRDELLEKAKIEIEELKSLIKEAIPWIENLDKNTTMEDIRMYPWIRPFVATHKAWLEKAEKIK